MKPNNYWKNDTIAKSCMLIIVLFCFCKQEYAQESKDARKSLQVISQVCSNYQHLPLHLELEISNKSNYIGSDRDTLTIQSEFDLSKKGSYIKLNSQEQLVNDSTILMVDHQFKSLLLLLQKNLNIQDQLKKFQQVMFGDSANENVAEEYEVARTNVDKDTVQITLTSKTPVMYTSIPYREITFEYVKSRLEPYRITQVTRILHPLNPEVYDNLSRDSTYRQYTLKAENNTYYFLKEQTTVTNFRKISHEELLPKTLRDYLSRGDKNQYIPKDTYNDYKFSIAN